MRSGHDNPYATPYDDTEPEALLLLRELRDAEIAWDTIDWKWQQQPRRSKTQKEEWTRLTHERWAVRDRLTETRERADAFLARQTQEA